jgi:hypothetical protein
VKRISTLALFAFLLLATPSHAGEARLWVCHGPAGQPLGSDGLFRVQVFDVGFGGGCDLPGSALTAGFTRDDPIGLSEAKVIVPVPPNVTLSGVTLDRQARGPGYTAGAVESESTGAALDGAVTLPATGTSVALDVKCGANITERCTGLVAAGFELRAMALTVQDTTGPMVAVGGTHSPATGVLNLDVRAADAGTGLRSVVAALDGAPISQAGFGGCAELSPADGTADVALGADCVHVGTAALTVDTAAVANGDHTLTVTVADIAGNAVSQSQTFEAVNPVVSPTATPTATATATASPTPTPISLPAPVVTATPTSEPMATPAARSTTSALVRLPKRVSRKGVYSVSVLCPPTATKTCAHRLTLKAQGKTIAAGKGTSKPGRRAQIALKLSSAARRTLARKGTLTATLTLSGAAPTTVRLRG